MRANCVRTVVMGAASLTGVSAVNLPFISAAQLFLLSLPLGRH
jgi:hypothetical protein